MVQIIRSQYMDLAKKNLLLYQSPWNFYFLPYTSFLPLSAGCHVMFHPGFNPISLRNKLLRISSASTLGNCLVLLGIGSPFVDD